MSIRFATDEEIARWSEFLVQNPDGGNVFQMHELGETKRRGGWRPLYVRTDSLSMLILQKTVPLLGAFWYIPKGPGVASYDELPLEELRQFARNHGVFAITIEPELADSPENHGILKGAKLIKTRAIQPNASTVIIDLDKPLDQILADLPQKGRNALRRAEREGVTVERVELTDKTARQMYELLTETAQGRFEASVRNYKYYREFWQRYVDSGRGALFFATYQGRLVAGAFVLTLGQKGLYKDGASVRDKVVYGASHLVQWRIIEWMHEQGITSYDLCGSPPTSRIDDKSHFQYGTGVFKRSFNKTTTDYVGAYDIVVNPTKYKIWKKFAERAVRSLYYRRHKQDWY